MFVILFLRMDIVPMRLLVVLLRRMRRLHLRLWLWSRLLHLRLRLWPLHLRLRRRLRPRLL